MFDPYQILGVPKTADQAEIKRAFRQLTQKYHPDKNPGDSGAESKFKDVSRAYEVLGDAEKRKLFDEFGEMSLTQGFDAERARAYTQSRRRSYAGGGPGMGGPGMGGGFGGFPGGFRMDFGGMGGAENMDFEELLSQLYGGGRIRDPGQRGPSRPRGGHDIEGEIRVSFLDAIVGVTVPLRVDGASGARTLDVRVPPGITDGGKLRLRGQGGPGTPPGDIVLTVHVDPNPRWERRDRDLVHKLPITALEAYGGAVVGVDTPWGRVDLKIPAGSQNGQSLRLRGKGVHGGNKPDGDLLITLDVRLPPAGDEELLAALQRLQANDNPRGT